MRKILITTIFALASFLSLTCAAPILAAEALTSQSGIRYITGGIGDEEAESLREKTQEYSLTLVFSQGSGGKIIDVNVAIYDAKGVSVFKLNGASPLLLVNLPAGTYRVIATYKDIKQGVTATVNGRKNTRVILHWKTGEPEQALEE